MISERQIGTAGRSEAQAIFAMMQHTQFDQARKRTTAPDAQGQFVQLKACLSLIAKVFHLDNPSVHHAKPIIQTTPKRAALPLSGRADSERRASHSSGQDSGFLAALDQMGARHLAANKAGALRQAFLDKLQDANDGSHKCESNCF